MAAQGKAFKELAEAVVEAYETSIRAQRGKNEGPGKGTAPRGMTAGAQEVARRARVPEKTVRDRMRLAEDLKNHPEVAARVDSGEITRRRRDRGAQAIKPKTPKNANHKPPGTANAVQARVASTATQPRLPDMLRIVHQR